MKKYNKRRLIIMMNPTDIELLETEEGKNQFDPEFLAEFENGKGDDEDQ